MIQDAEQYREYIKSRLHPVSEILPNIALGDFSSRLDIPAEKDEFTDLYVGINYLLGDLDEQMRKREYAERALKESEQKYKTLFDTSPEGIVIIDLDGNVLECNTAVQDITKLTAEEIKGRQFMELGLLGPKELQKIIDLFPKLLDGDFSGTAEVEIQTGGEKRYLEAFPAVIEKNSEIGALQVIVRDITEEKHAGEELKKSEENFRDLFENANDLIQSVDAEGKFVYVNTKWLETMGYSREELKKLHFTDIISKEQISHCMDAFSKVCCGETYDKIETVFIAKDGREIIVEGNVNAHFKDGGFVSTRGIFRDITERKKTEEKLRDIMGDLERSNRELEQFAYAASHDLQEPLRMVSSYVSLLEKRYKHKLDTDAKEFIEYTVEGTSRMQQLINDLLVYSRVGTRGKPFESTDMEDVIRLAKDNLKIAIEESSAVIINDPLPELMVDKIQLSQLMQNLIGNSIKFTGGKQPQIKISAESKKNHWLFSVRDNGIGIEPKYKERIFQIFQRLHSRSEYKGTGIGLAVCKKIVERHNGQIWVESEPGKGSTFYFTIPNTGGDIR